MECEKELQLIKDQNKNCTDLINYNVFLTLNVFSGMKCFSEKKCLILGRKYQKWLEKEWLRTQSIVFNDKFGLSGLG